MNYVDLPQFTDAFGSLRLPGSKSISNRVLLLSALAKGTTKIHHLLHSDDTRFMLEALQTLGISHRDENDVCVIEGCAGVFPNKNADLFLGNAGTAFRSLTAALAFADGNYTLKGVARMHERPIGDLVLGLQSLGANIEYLENAGFPPLKIAPLKIAPRNKNSINEVSMKGNVSSQFLTGLLMALPLSGEAFTIHVDGELISRPYVEMTLKIMARFGVLVANDHFQHFHVPAKAQYQAVPDFLVEGDASSASYFLGLGALAGKICVYGVGKNSLQGDIHFADALGKMGAIIEMGEDFISAAKPENGKLKGIVMDAKEIPDAAMTFATLALFADAPTQINNIGSWRVKETDRILAMHTELTKLGATVESGENFIKITPPAKIKNPHQGIDTYDDHRMAMCFSLASFATPLRINEPSCVAKTFPTYFAEMGKMVQNVPVIAIDGPSASGKGSVAAKVAEKLGWHYLDSGALYRLTALAAEKNNIALIDEHALAEIAASLNVRFVADTILMNNENVTEQIRVEAISIAASKIAALPKVREALLFRQRAFRVFPGLVADGRDMGSVVFLDAPLKVFLTASAEIRAERRTKQLSAKGISVNMRAVLTDLQARDARDSARSVAPLKQEKDAKLLETSFIGIEEAVLQVIDWLQK